MPRRARSERLPLLAVPLNLAIAFILFKLSLSRSKAKAKKPAAKK